MSDLQKPCGWYGYRKLCGKPSVVHMGNEPAAWHLCAEHGAEATHWNLTPVAAEYHSHITKTLASIVEISSFSSKVTKAAKDVVACMTASLPPTREEIRDVVLLVMEMKQAHEAATQSNNKATEIFQNERGSESEWLANEKLGCLNRNNQELEQWAQSIIAVDELVATLLKAVPKPVVPEVNVEVELPSQPSLAGRFEVSDTNYGESLFSIKRPITTHRTIDVKKT